MRIRDVRRTNEGANKQAVEIDAALSPAKRHATSLMHMTHVGREKGSHERKRERNERENKKKGKNADPPSPRRVFSADAITSDRNVTQRTAT